MKVIRNWKLLDWCTGDVFTYVQVIKATDEKAPTFNVKDVTISVDPWGCAAKWTVEKPWELEEHCGKSEELKWGVKVPAGVSVRGSQPNYAVTGMPKGRHAILYWAEDCCGNRSEKTAYVTVIDARARVAVAKQNIVMSLTGSGTGADGAGKIYVGRSIEIEDEIGGFSPEEMKTLFITFKKYKALPTGNESSTGLGLFVAKAMAERVSGTITCKTEEGKGSVFSVLLPATYD